MESNGFFLLLVAISAIILFKLSHFILVKIKFRSSKSPFFILNLSIIIFIIICFIISFKYNFLLKNYIIYSASVYFCLIMIYLHLFIGISKSLSLRVMHELFIRNNHKMTLEELDKRFPKINMVKKRLDLMVENNWLIESNNSYSYNKKSIIIIKINIFLKKIFFLSESG